MTVFVTTGVFDPAATLDMAAEFVELAEPFPEDVDDRETLGVTEDVEEVLNDNVDLVEPEIVTELEEDRL